MKYWYNIHGYLAEFRILRNTECEEDFNPPKEKEGNMRNWITILLLVGSAVAAVLFRIFYGIV